MLLADAERPRCRPAGPQKGENAGAAGTGGPVRKGCLKNSSNEMRSTGLRRSSA